MKKYKIIDKALQLVEVPIPSLEPHKVLVKIVACGVNRADIYQIKGHYPPPAGEEDVPGLEISGIVVDVGSEVSSWQVGDRVIALLAAGGYAEYINIDPLLLIKVPVEIDLLVAASIAEAYATSWYNLYQLAQIRAGQNILIYGGSGGLGSAAIQLGKLYGANITTIVSTEDKAAFCYKLGADNVILYGVDAAYMKLCQEFTPKGYDIIFDILGGTFLNRNLELAAFKATILLLGLLDNRTSLLHIDQILFKNLRVIGSTLRAQPIVIKEHILTNIAKDIIPCFVNKRLIPTLDKIFPFSEANQALQYMTKSIHKGKIVLQV